MEKHNLEELPELAITQQDSLLTKVCLFFSERKIKAYLVGGAVRDMLISRETSDIDITVNGNALEVAAQLAEVLKGKYVLLDEINRVGRVVVTESGKQWNFDLASLRGDIEQDLSERDFTVNALAVAFEQFSGESLCFNRLAGKLVNLPIIDPYNGQVDLQQGVIRMVSPGAFNADPVRLLRAVRLAAELDFTIDEPTESAIKCDARKITQIAGERVREELVRLLAVPGSGRFLRYLDGLGLLIPLIPELEPARETTQPVEHYWRVLEHSMYTATAVDYLLRQGEWEYPDSNILSAIPWSEQIAIHFAGEIGYGSSRSTLLKLAALLHDIAKPQTKAVTGEGRVRFLGHDKAGAVAAAAVLERLRFSTREIRYIELCIRYHLRPTQLTHEEMPSKRALYRYFRDTGEAAVDIMFFSLADHLATRGPLLNLALWQEHAKLIEYVLAQYYKVKESVAPPKLLDGHDLINLFGLKPGPMMGELLEKVREAVAAGEISSHEEALNYVSNILKDRTGN